MQDRSFGYFVIASLLSLACGSGGKSAIDPGGSNATGGMTAGAGGTSDAGMKIGDAAPARCMVSLSGAVMTSIPCSRAYVVWSHGTETSTFIMDGLEPNFAHDFNVSIELPAKPELKTYASLDPDADRYSYLKVEENLLRWEAHGGPTGMGNYSVTFTDLGPESQGEFDIRWHEVHGSLQATLVAAGSNGETGEIAFSVTF